MNKDCNKKIIIFGHKYDYDYLSANTAQDIIQEAYEKTNIAFEPDIEVILDVLDNISDAWSSNEYHIRKKAKELLTAITSFSPEMIDEGLDKVSEICSSKRLIEKINNELGCIDYLNEGKIYENKDSNELDYRIKAQPKGIILHINSNNLFFEIIESWVWGIITKNVNIIKTEEEYLPFALLFLDSIKEFDSSEIIWNNQSLLFWNNDNKSINDVFYKSDLLIIYQGDINLLNYIKPELGSEIELIDNSYKYSFSIIEGKCLKPNIPSDLINGLALDICRWNQKSSFSPHLVYVIDKDLKTSHQLIEALFDEMVAVGEEFPCGVLTFDEKVKIRKIREISRMMQVKGEGRLVCPEDFSFTLVLDYNSAFKLSCLNRTIFIKRITNLENLIELLIPYSEKLHSVGLFVSEELKYLCEKEFPKLGIKHILKIGKMESRGNDISQNGIYILRKLVDFISIDY